MKQLALLTRNIWNARQLSKWGTIDKIGEAVLITNLSSAGNGPTQRRPNKATILCLVPVFVTSSSEMVRAKLPDVSEQGSRRALEYALSIIRFTKTAVPVDIACVALSSLEGLVCIVRVRYSSKKILIHVAYWTTRRIR